MLRTILVLVVFAIGIGYSIRSPFYGLLLYLATAYFRPEQWVWTDLIAQLNLSLLAGAILLGSTFFSLPTQRFRLNLQVALIGVFFLHSLISTSVSEHPDWSWKYWQDFAKVLIVVYLIPVLVTNRERLRITFVVIAFALGFEAAKQGWIGLLTGAARNANDHPMLGDNNGVALAMMMFVPLLAVLAQTARSRWERYLHRFLLLGAFIRGVLTYSRGGLIAAGAIVLYQVLRSKHRIRMLLSIVIISAIVFPALPQSFWDRMATIRAAPEEQDQSARGRLHFWQTAMAMAAARPLTGVGVNGFQTSYNDYDPSLGAFGSNRAVHSTWFGVAADLGFVGAFLFLSILFCAFAACRRVRRLGKAYTNASELVPFATALEGSLIAFVVAGTFLNAQYFEMFWHVVGLTVALQFAAEAAVRECAYPTVQVDSVVHKAPVMPGRSLVPRPTVFRGTSSP